MSEFEMKIEALTRCVDTQTYEKALAEVKRATVHKLESSAISADLDQLIQTILVELGIPAHIKGYRYIITGLHLTADNPEIIEAITKELYPRIAKIHDTTPTRVERAIRHAVEVGWDRGDLDVQYKYFGNTVSCHKGKPTNSEFLAMISDILKRKVK